MICSPKIKTEKRKSVSAASVSFCIQRKIANYLEESKELLTFAAENKIITIMTTVELRTSIMEELDQMSVEMLESVSKYVKRLRHHTRSARKVKTDQNKREAAMLFVKNLSVQGGMPVPAEERGVEALVNEKYDK